MGKLQLYMTMSRGDFKHMYSTNATDDVKQWVCDLSDAVRQVDYNPKHKHIFYMVKYIESGAFIVVLRTIPREHGHHLASWIFVPYSLKISNAEVCRLTDFIAGIVSKDSVGKAEIEEIAHEFDNPYPEDPLAPQFAPNDGSTYCYRYYGGNTDCTLRELIGQYRYQNSYLSYAGTLLVDVEVTSNISGSNLTSAPKTAMVVLLPPINPIVNGYKPTIYGEKFDVPFFVPYQETIEVTWHKPGAPDKRVPVCASLNENRCPGLESASPSQAIESRPQVLDTHVEQPRQQSSQLLWEPEPKKPAPAPVPAPKPVEERKPRAKHAYVFEMPTTEGTNVRFKFESDYVLDESPIEGYIETDTIEEGTNRVNRLVPKVKGFGILDMIKDKGLWVLGGLVVGFVLALLCTCGRGLKTIEQASKDSITDSIAKVDSALTAQTNPTEVQPVTPPQQQDPQEQQQQQDQHQQQTQPANNTPVSSQAISYLDNNKKWTKEEMEKFPELAGLYEDLRTINYDNIINVWGPKLAKSKTFSDRIVKHTQQGKNKLHRIKPPKNPYCPADDHSITVQPWLNNVDPSPNQK